MWLKNGPARFAWVAAVLMLGATGVGAPSEATVPSASPLEATASSARAPRTSIAVADRIADVLYFSDEMDREPDVIDYPWTDLEKAWFYHGGRAVTVVARISTLRRSMSAGNYHNVAFTTTRWPRGGAFVTLYPQQDGSVDIDTNLRCSRTRLTARVNWARDYYTVRVPRTCLRSPRWVKVSITNSLFDQNAGWYDYLNDGSPTPRLYHPR
jgi:hypothetical protein